MKEFEHIFLFEGICISFSGSYPVRVLCPFSLGWTISAYWFERPFNNVQKVSILCDVSHKVLGCFLSMVFV